MTLRRWDFALAFRLPLPLVLLIRRGSAAALEVAVAFLVVIPEGDLLAHVPLQFQHPHSKQRLRV
jgi:hypothetical protein